MSNDPREPNLGPLVDLMVVLVAVLLLSGVATISQTLAADQQLSDPCGIWPPPVEFAPPPLTLHVSHDRWWVGRWVGGGEVVPRGPIEGERAALERLVARDRWSYPDDPQVIVVVDDGESYEEMVMALDVARAFGYSRSLLGGGPAR